MTETALLVHAAQAGDRQALEELYARHRGRLVAFLRVAASPALQLRVAPEDLAQETLLESARKFGEFEPRGPASFYAWLVQIARYKVSEAERALRARKREAERPLEVDPAHSATSPSLAAMRSEGAQWLRAALTELPEAQGEALRLRYLEGLTLAEAAARLGRSEAALKALVTRAFAALAGRLDAPE